MEPIKINGQEITPEVLDITYNHDEGTIRVDTSPLPEHILVTADLWTEIEQDQPGIAEWTRLEEIGHADEDVTNDGYVLHIDASNVALAYKLLEELPDGNRLLQLVSWAER